MERISSRQNPVVKRFRELARDGPAGGAVLLDGIHLVEEALDSGVPLEVVAIDESAGRLLATLGARATATGARVLAVAEPVMAALSPVKHPSGVVAIARSGPAALDRALEGGPQLVLLVSGVQDPGNVGAIVRAAEAFGATGLVTGEETADPFGWKALRGAMGSAFRLPISVREPQVPAARAARAAGLRLFASVPRGGTAPDACRFLAPSAIILGGEGSGLGPELIDAADQRLTIPMQPPVESLNVAIAAALILYEASRQRQRS